MSSTTPPDPDDPLRPASPQEAAWLARSKAQLQQAPLTFDVAAHWQSIAARLPASPAAAATSTSPLPQRPHRLRLLSSRWSAWLGGWALGAACAAGVIAAVGLHPPGTAPASVQPLSAASAVRSDQVLLQVVFADNARIGEIRALLAPLSVQVVAGPGSLGVWRIAVPAAQARAAQRALAASALVESVNPVR